MNRLIHSEMVHMLHCMAQSKRKWLRDFSVGRNKRPDWNIQGQQEQLQALEQAQADYQAAADRDQKQESAA